jgi:hypothetical protein
MTLNFVHRTGIGLASLAAGASVLLATADSFAAETVVLKYGPFREKISVAELAELAETGEPSPDLAGYIRLADKEPAEIQAILNKSVKADPVKLDRLLNSALGEIVLEKLAEAIHTPGGGADQQALRAALILSASQDGEITLIEALQNYPTQEVHVEGEKIAAALRQFSRFQKQADKVRDILKLF